MASCDDDFALLGGDEAQSHHHQQQQQAAVSFSSAAAAAAAVNRYVSAAKGGRGVGVSGHPRNSLVSHHSIDAKVAVAVTGEDHEGFGEAFVQADCFADEDPGSNNNPFVSHHDEEDGEDNNNGDKSRALVTGPGPHHHHHHHHHHQPLSRPDPKRKEREDLSDDGESPSPYCYNSGGSATKKSRPAAAAAPSSSSGGDYRKDREEWSDSAIGCLLDAYTDKYVQLNRGNLRGRDWEDVATTVSERCDKHKSGKSVEQCKNKVDNLKKRYKVECQRLSSGSLPVSHWPWFKKMEQIVGSSSSTSKVATDDEKSPALAGSSVAAMRQVKRYSVAACPSASLANNFNKKMSNPRWKRVVLKISGAALTGSGQQNVDPKVIMLIAREVALASRVGVEVAIVVGGRNFFCGETWLTATGTDRTTTYQIGMMASVMNSLLLQASLEKIGVETRVQTAFMMQEIAEPYIRRRAIRHLEKGRVVIFGGIGAGTGNPLFTTDTAAALRASEINAEAVLKGVNTDVVYECHPRNNSVDFEHISFRECASRGFTAMDMTAITFCEENNIPVVLFNFLESGNISRALCGEQVGTFIDQSGRIS